MKIEDLFITVWVACVAILALVGFAALVYMSWKMALH